MRRVFQTILLLTFFSATALPEAVVSLLKTKAERGDVNAQKELGKRYRAGTGVFEDPKLSFYWYRLAAEQGDAEAQTELGWMYYRGYGALGDWHVAEEWLSKAIEQENLKAMLILGWMYEPDHGSFRDGRLFPKNQGAPEGTITQELYRKAAEQGLVEAQVGLAWLHMSSWARLDWEELMHWLYAASDQKNAHAMDLLGGHLYAALLPPGVERDLVEAYMWLKLAAIHGISQSESIAAEVSLEMTPDQIKEAEARAKDWLKDHAKPSGR